MWALNLMTDILMREREREIRDTDTQGRGRPCEGGGRDWNAWGYQSLEVESKDSPLEPSRGV